MCQITQLKLAYYAIRGSCRQVESGGKTPRQRCRCVTGGDRWIDVFSVGEKPKSGFGDRTPKEFKVICKMPCISVRSSETSMKSLANGKTSRTKGSIAGRQRKTKSASRYQLWSRSSCRDIGRMNINSTGLCVRKALQK